MPRHSLLCVVAGGFAIAAGCSSRGADDRVAADIARTEVRGPGYAVVAWRPVDRARLAGNVVIITSGEEPVFVQPAAYHHLPIEDAGTAHANTAELLRRMTAVEVTLAAQLGQTASPATPAPPPPTPPALGAPALEPAAPAVASPPPIESQLPSVIPVPPTLEPARGTSP